MAQIKTVGDLRKLLEGKPDSMEIVPSIGPDIEDLLIFSDTTIDEATVGFFAACEVGDDDVERIYILVDGEAAVDADLEDEDGDEEGGNI